MESSSFTPFSEAELVLKKDSTRSSLPSMEAMKPSMEVRRSCSRKFPLTIFWMDEDEDLALCRRRKSSLWKRLWIALLVIDELKGAPSTEDDMGREDKIGELSLGLHKRKCGRGW